MCVWVHWSVQFPRYIKFCTTIGFLSHFNEPNGKKLEYQINFFFAPRLDSDFNALSYSADWLEFFFCFTVKSIVQILLL